MELIYIFFLSFLFINVKSFAKANGQGPSVEQVHKSHFQILGAES
jgi:hypothetical protein